MAVDSDSGSVYVSGSVSGVQLDDQTNAASSGTSDVVLLKYNSSGNWQWTRMRGGVNGDAGLAG